MTIQLGNVQATPLPEILQDTAAQEITLMERADLEVVQGTGELCCFGGGTQMVMIYSDVTESPGLTVKDIGLFVNLYGDNHRVAIFMNL
jgi:hypothetical protein